MGQDCNILIDNKISVDELREYISKVLDVPVDTITKAGLDDLESGSVLVWHIFIEFDFPSDHWINTARHFLLTHVQFIGSELSKTLVTSRAYPTWLTLSLSIVKHFGGTRKIEGKRRQKFEASGEIIKVTPELIEEQVGTSQYYKEWFDEEET